MTPQNITYRIARLERQAVYVGMTAARERAIARMWRFHHLACVGA